MSYVIIDRNELWQRIKRTANYNGKDVKDKSGVTIGEIAREIVLYFLSKNDVDATSIKMIEMSGTAAAYHLMEVSLRLCKDGKLKFFTKAMLNDIATAKELYRMVSILRFGQDVDNWLKNALNNITNEVNRVSDVLCIYEEFCKDLESEGIYDEPRYICEAVQKLSDDADRKEYTDFFGVPEMLHLDQESLSIKERCLEELLGAKPINFNNLFGNVTDTERKINFFKAYGIENEIRNIVKKLSENDWSVGDINIYYPSDIYESYIASVLGREGIPYAFVTGKKISSGYVNLIKAILVWAMNGFQYSDYRNILASELMKDKCYGVDRRNEQIIGWGRERYSQYAEKKMAGINAAMNDKMTSEEFKNADKKTQKEIEDKYDRTRAYYQMMKDLADTFVFMDDANEGEGRDIRSLYNRLIEIMDKNTRRMKNPERGSTLRVLRDCKSEVAVMSEMLESSDEQDAVKKLSVLYDYINALRKNCPERPDAITISKYGKIDFSDRKIHFFVGMSMAELKVSEDESPVLTDDELMQLSGEKGALAGSKAQKYRTAIENTIENASGEIYMSYTYYDTGNQLESAPSSLIDKYLNEQKPSNIEEVGFDVIDKCYSFGVVYVQDKDNDSDNKTDVAHVKIEELYNVDDADEECHDDDETEDCDDVDEDCHDDDETEDYDNVDEDYYDDDDEELRSYLDEADDDDEGEEICYKPVPDKTERKQNKREAWLSPTSIETMLNCPRAFTYQHLECLPENEDYEVREDQWLPANVKGSFIHEVMKEYVQKCFIDKQSPDIDSIIFDSVYKKICADYESDYPILNKQVAYKEKSDIKTKLEDYLKKMHDSFVKEKWKVLATEDKKASDELLEKINSERRIPEISNKEYLVFNFNGIVDRIDYKEDENGNKTEFRIVDYKTGKKDILEKKKRDGLLAQYDLYIRLLEEIPEVKGKPISFEYHFILSDNGFEVLKGEKDDVLFNNIKLAIYNLFYSDNPLPLEKTDDRCKYCKYVEICNVALALNGGK